MPEVFTNLCGFLNIVKQSYRLQSVAYRTPPLPTPQHLAVGMTQWHSDRDTKRKTETDRDRQRKVKTETETRDKQRS